MVGAHKGDHAALDHRDRVPAHPDIFPEQRPGAGIVLRDPATLAVEDRMDRDRRGRGQGGDRLDTRPSAACSGVRR
jgi:hypothetical protein